MAALGMKGLVSLQLKVVTWKCSNTYMRMAVLGMGALGSMPQNQHESGWRRTGVLRIMITVTTATITATMSPGDSFCTM